MSTFDEASLNDGFPRVEPVPVYAVRFPPPEPGKIYPVPLSKTYEEGYRDGFRDGFAEGKKGGAE